MAAQAARAVARRPLETAAPAQRRAKLAVAPAPVAVPRARFVVLVLAVVVVGVLGILLLNTRINENAFRLYELRQQQAELDQRQQELEAQIAEANSTAQLSAAARRLGLVRVSGDELGRIRLPSGEVIGDPVPVAGDQPAPEGTGPDASTDEDGAGQDGSGQDGATDQHGTGPDQDAPDPDRPGPDGSGQDGSPGEEG